MSAKPHKPKGGLKAPLDNRTPHLGRNRVSIRRAHAGGLVYVFPGFLVPDALSPASKPLEKKGFLSATRGASPAKKGKDPTPAQGDFGTAFGHDRGIGLVEFEQAVDGRRGNRRGTGQHHKLADQVLHLVTGRLGVLHQRGLHEWVGQEALQEENHNRLREPLKKPEFTGCDGEPQDMQNPKGFAHRAERQDQEVPGASQPVVIDPGSAQGRRQRMEEKRDVVL